MFGEIMVHAYKKGYRFELDMKKEYENNGWKVVRSSGSHSPVDLVCLKDKDVVCIQCKNTSKPYKLTKSEIENVKEWVKSTGFPVNVAYKHNGKRVVVVFS